MRLNTQLITLLLIMILLVDHARGLSRPEALQHNSNNSTNNSEHNDNDSNSNNNSNIRNGNTANNNSRNNDITNENNSKAYW